MYDSIGTTTNNRDRPPTAMVGSSVSVEANSDGRVRKMSRKKHPQRRERRKVKEQQKEMDQLVDRRAMDMTGDSASEWRDEEESSIAEEYELLNDQLQREREFYEAGQAEDSDINDEYSESGTDKDMPSMVGRMEDDASSDDSSGNGSCAYHTDNDNSSIEDSDDDCSMPGLQERSRDDSSSDNSLSVRKENVKSPTAPKIPHTIDTRPIIP